jgi:integrase
MARRAVELPKGVWFQKKRLADGRTVRYGYFGRGPGTEALGLEGSPEFHTRLAEVLSRAPQEGKVSYLVWRYLQSKEFSALRDRTRGDYRKHLDRIRAKFGTLSLGAMAAPQIAQHIYAWRDELAEASPRQADYAVSVLGAMLAWGVKRGFLNHNRAAGIEDVYKPDRTANVWSEDQESAFLKDAPAPIARAFILAVETGLAQEDVLVLPWSAVRGNLIVARRLKNGTPVAVPISPKLRATLDGAPRGDSLTILTKADGLPFDPKGNGLRSLFRLATAKAEVTGRTFHDLRRTFVTRRRALGWTAEETALCSGHKVRDELGAQGAYVDRQAVAIANAERLWSRFYGPQGEQKLQTDLQTAADAKGLSH